MRMMRTGWQPFAGRMIVRWHEKIGAVFVSAASFSVETLAGNETAKVS